jgi:predicted NAD-dependent protein-ADP-ribosyltransferase YbiA (DUF1768 family)
MGTLIFGEIKKLVDNWWTSLPANDPADVWTTWDRDTYYLWGANSGNYDGIPVGGPLNGDGMASVNSGPTRGRAHPHYVGVITMAQSDLPKNDPIFQALAAKLTAGQDVVIPTFHGKLSLGTGIGGTIPHWDAIQEYLLRQIHALGASAKSVTIPAGTFWPDLRPHKGGQPYPISQLDDLITLANMLSTKTMTTTPSMDQRHPIPQPIQIGNDHYTVVAFYYPGHADPCDLLCNAGCFGNFYPCTIVLDHPLNGQKITPTPTFQTAEAAFQSLKWWNCDWLRALFGNATTGSQVYDYTQGRQLPPGMTLPPADDDSLHGYAGLGREGAMAFVETQKYTQNQDLQSALLSTGGAYLLEHAHGPTKDHFWNDNGINKLGRTLMHVRAKLPGGQGAPAGTDTDSMVPQFKKAVADLLSGGTR